MKQIVAGMLASVAALALVSACGSDDDSTTATTATTAGAPAADTTATTTSAAAAETIPAATLPGGTIPGGTIPGGPGGLTIPPGAIPSDLSIPQQAIDQMLSQMEAAGIKVDRACFTTLLQDEALRKVVAAGGTPSPEVMQRFAACITP